MRHFQLSQLRHALLPAIIPSLVSCGGDTPKVDLSTLQAPIACADLKQLSVPASAIGLPTGGASVESAQMVETSGSGADLIGAHCKVIAAIAAVDKNAPPIRLQLHLPVNWNQKTFHFGGGGYDGELGVFLNAVFGGPLDQLTPQGRGYAVFSSDAGHTQKEPFIFGRDASFATNDEALKNFGGDQLKKTRDAALYILDKHYRRPVQKQYFFGGSTGGREALTVLQRWPENYDGVISFFPAWNTLSMELQFGRITRALAQPGAYLNVAKRSLILQAAVANCDALDGVSDSIIGNVAACNAQFDPATATLNGAPVRCTNGLDSGDTCLSDAQIAALKVMNTPARFNFTLASGETGYPGINVWGADLGIPSTNPELALNQILGLNALAPAHPFTPDMPYLSVFYDQWAKYFVTRDANFNSLTLDPENPGPWAQRISDLSLMFDANKTDLSAFANKGGKLLLLHGTADALVSSRASANYFERVQAKMGANTTAAFFKYYEVPAYGHNASATFNIAWDSVSALENWVERGVAPTNQVVTDRTGIPGRTRPLCEYPTWPKYKGSGDPNLASNFICSQ